MNTAMRVISCMLFLLLIGCGKAEVTGKVQFDGKQVMLGTVQIQGADGIPRSAILSPEGIFAFKDLKPGKYKVAVASPDPVAEAKQIASMQRTKPGEAPAVPKEVSEGDRKNWFPLPSAAGVLETSGMTIEVKSGKQQITVEIPK